MRWWCLVGILIWFWKRYLIMICDWIVIWPIRLLWLDELNPRVRCAFGNIFRLTCMTFWLHDKNQFLRILCFLLFINFDVRNGAKKLGHLDHPLQSYGQIYFNIFWYISTKLDLIWFKSAVLNCLSPMRLECLTSRLIDVGLPKSCGRFLKRCKAEVLPHFQRRNLW